MSYFEWTSKRLRRHLGAVSYEHDQALIKHGLDPKKMRKTFYDFFTKKSVEIDAHVDLLDEMVDTNIVGATVYDVDSAGYELYDCGSCGREWDDHLLVWKEGDEFRTCYAKRSQSTHMGMNLDWGNTSYTWSLEPQKKADFVEITLAHHLLVKDICEKFGYNEIIEYMRTIET